MLALETATMNCFFSLRQCLLGSGALAAGIVLIPVDSSLALSAAAEKQARVTRVIRDVKLLREKADPQPATVNDKVSEDTSVRTGDQSRSELTFVDLTISRLGANTIFSFNKAGRNVRLNGGAMLLCVPKDSGGAQMKTDACSVAVTGTTLILEAMRSGRTSLAVLEGGARMALNKNPKESAYVRGGQMLDVPAGATKMPAPTDIDVDKVMKQHPLVTDFGPLPSQNLIYASRNNPSGPVYQGQVVDVGPTRPAPPFMHPIVRGGGGGGNNPPNRGDGTAGGGEKRPPKGGKQTPTDGTGYNGVSTSDGVQTQPAGALGARGANTLGKQSSTSSLVKKRRPPRRH